MLGIEACSIPEGALLGVYRRDGVYTDCYRTSVAGEVCCAQYVTAFYTTWIFKLERAILAWAVSRPSSDAQARRLGEASLQTFAAWSVEKRSAGQLLMCDMHGRTRSWLMVLPGDAAQPSRTDLYFGSAVVSVPRPGRSVKALAFRLLLGFHKLYSRVLLHAARRRLRRQRRDTRG